MGNKMIRKAHEESVDDYGNSLALQRNRNASRLYRYEMEWKDRVFTDVTYYILDEHRTLVGMNCVNNRYVMRLMDELISHG